MIQYLKVALYQSLETRTKKKRFTEDSCIAPFGLHPSHLRVSHTLPIRTFRVIKGKVYIFVHQRCCLSLHTTVFFFYWSLRDSKSSQVSRTLFNILANFNNAVVWIVSTCPLISKPSNSFTNLLGVVLSALITTSITVMFDIIISRNNCGIAGGVDNSQHSPMFILLDGGSVHFEIWSNFIIGLAVIMTPCKNRNSNMNCTLFHRTDF